MTTAKHLKRLAKEQSDMKGYELASNMKTHYTDKIFETKGKKQTCQIFLRNMSNVTWQKL